MEKGLLKLIEQVIEKQKYETLNLQFDGIFETKGQTFATVEITPTLSQAYELKPARNTSIDILKHTISNKTDLISLTYETTQGLYIEDIITSQNLFFLIPEVIKEISFIQKIEPETLTDYIKQNKIIFCYLMKEHQSEHTKYNF